MNLIPVILSGGSGTRLWPLSRDLYPKQLIELLGERSLLQDTALRAAEVTGSGAPILVCNEEHRFMVAEQMREIGCPTRAILLEPVGRNTAPAIAVAARAALEAAGPDACMLVLPADHVIPDVDAFARAVAAAAELAAAGEMVTFGITPTRAETGFGYIAVGDPIGDGGARRIAGFREKPDAATAAALVEGGDHLWNSGMFVFPAARYLGELQQHEPDVHRQAESAWSAARMDLDFTRLDTEAFAACPSISVDYAVMERIASATVVPLAAGWDDVGSWSALWALGDRDDDGNLSSGDVIAVDSRGSYLRAEHRLLATVGIDDLVVIETADAVLVAHRDRVQDVKTVVQRLAESDREERLVHPRVFRPWGSFERIARGERYEVKRIRIRPGGAQSLQSHARRAEHFIVVRGRARVTREDDTFEVGENESTFIPPGSRHRIENPFDEPLEMVEVRSGDYLGEDDIVRHPDA